MARVATSLLKRLCPDHSVAEPHFFMNMNNTFYVHAYCTVLGSWYGYENDKANMFKFLHCKITGIFCPLKF